MRHPFLRTLAGSAATPTDPNFENVTLLLHGDGTNGGQNNTFVDGSTNNFTITRNGNTTQGTFSPYGDNWSNYFDGSGDFLSIPSNAAFAYGTSDFTVECWVYKLTSATMAVLDSNTGSPGTFGFAISSTQITGYQTWGTAFTFTHTLALHSWQHIAFVRTSGTLYLYVNGAQIGSTAASQNFVSSQPLIVGRNAGSGADQYNGYISNLRIVKGTAVYTVAFTPPTAPLTAITNTSLLTCQSNRLRDASTNNFTITRNGDVSVQRFSPFSPTAAYAAGTIGGSGYFDGTGDYLGIASTTSLNLSSGDWTVECWWFPTSNTAQNPVMINYNAGTDGYAHARIATSVSPNAFYGLSSTNGTSWISTTGGGSWAVGNWYHLAYVRQGSTFTLFVNGVSVLSYSNASNLFASNGISEIGRTSSSVSNFAYVNGYISNVRVVKGTAVYTAAFTPPTAPLTAITNTSLLLNFTNAAILDNAMMAVPETVGNVQIDTTTKKYGTGSLEFDGTGDWLLIPDSPDQRLGTGNFTIECWLYLAATGTARGIVGKGTSTTGWLLSTNTSNAVVFTYGTSTITSTGTLSGTTWYHIAVVREGTGTNQTKIYIGGTNDGTGTVATDFTQTNAAYVGANRTGGDPMNGYIDDLRITKGVARYTANFTPPTAAFPDL